MVRAAYCIAALWLVCLPLSSLAAAKATPEPVPSLRFSTQVRAENHAFQVRKAFLENLCQRLQWQCSLESYPPQRVEILLRSGDIDGEIGRAAIFSSIVPEAVRVPTQFSQVRFAIFGLVQNTAIKQAKSWQDLTNLRVVYIRGYKFIERHTEISQLYPVDNYHSCIGMLQLRRADVCLISSEHANILIAESGKPRADFYLQEFDTEALYIYLSRQRAALVPQMDRMIKKMRADGSLDAIFSANEKKRPGKSRE